SSGDKAAIRPEGGPAGQTFLDLFENDEGDDCVDQLIMAWFFLKSQPRHGLVNLYRLAYPGRSGPKPRGQDGVLVGGEEIDGVLKHEKPSIGSIQGGLTIARPFRCQSWPHLPFGKTTLPGLAGWRGRQPFS